MHIRLKDYVVVSKKDNICVISRGVKHYEIEDINSEYFDFFSLREWLKREINDELFQFMVNEKLIIQDYKNNYEGTLKEKNIYFFESQNHIEYIKDINEIQSSIQSKKVAILGCGGIGTVVLQNLISFGVSNFILIDFDKVELSNLNRQLFFNLSDIGLSKSIVLKNKINNIDKKINVKSIISKVSNEIDLKNILLNENIDFLVNCADFPKNINSIVHNVCSNLNTPFIEGVVGIETGTWGPIVCQDTMKYGKIGSILSGNTIRGSICSTNMLIGTFMSNDILNYFLDNKSDALYHRKYINFNQYKICVEE